LKGVISEVLLIRVVEIEPKLEVLTNETIELLTRGGR